MRHLAHLAFALGVLVASLLVATTLTTAGEPAQRHLELKQLMLELINDVRREAGVPEVQLGTNDVAQLHADQMVAGCFSGHWGLDGLKPYMRYSLLGGYQSNAENAHGRHLYPAGGDPCAVRASTARPDLDWLVRNAMTRLLNSPGHRRTLLDPNHRLVNVGIAWRGGEHYIFRVAQHFEGDYVRLDRPPSLAGGTLTLSGRVINNASLQGGMTVYHDPRPQPQTREALNEASSTCGGYPVGAVHPYREGVRVTTSSSTPDCWEPALRGARSDGSTIALPTIIADQWDITDTTFDIQADLSSLLDEHGPGVYTVKLRGEVGGKDARLLEFALFHGFVFPNRAFVYAGGTTTASGLTERDSLGGVYRWDGEAWQMYALYDGQLIPGAVDFPISPGDWLWLTDHR